MWPNTTTGKLTGSHRKITDLWWATGTDKLAGRTIEVGPYAEETVYTLCQWLDSARANRLNAYLEVKGEARQSLPNTDAAIRAQARSELLTPVRERYADQVVTMYSNDAAIAAEPCPLPVTKPGGRRSWRPARPECSPATPGSIASG